MNEGNTNKMGKNWSIPLQSKVCTSPLIAKMYSSTSSEKWTITIDTKLGNRNKNDLGKGVMIQLGYISYIST